MNNYFKMRSVYYFLLVSLFAISPALIRAQEIKMLTFEEVIKLSEDQSPNALMAKHRFRASYWQYRTFVAQYRPSLTMTGTTPDFSNSYDKVWNSTEGGYQYRTSNTLSNLAALSLSQNIGITGGSIALQSDLTLFNDLENDNRQY